MLLRARRDPGRVAGGSHLLGDGDREVLVDLLHRLSVPVLLDGLLYPGLPGVLALDGLLAEVGPRSADPFDPAVSVALDALDPSLVEIVRGGERGAKLHGVSARLADLGRVLGVLAHLLEDPQHIVQELALGAGLCLVGHVGPPVRWTGQTRGSGDCSGQFPRCRVAGELRKY